MSGNYNFINFVNFLSTCSAPQNVSSTDVSHSWGRYINWWFFKLSLRREKILLDLAIITCCSSCVNIGFRRPLHVKEGLNNCPTKNGHQSGNMCQGSWLNRIPGLSSPFLIKKNPIVIHVKSKEASPTSRCRSREQEMSPMLRLCPASDLER